MAAAKVRSGRRAGLRYSQAYREGPLRERPGKELCEITSSPFVCLAPLVRSRLARAATATAIATAAAATAAAGPAPLPPLPASSPSAAATYLCCSPTWLLLRLPAPAPALPQNAGAELGSATFVMVCSRLCRDGGAQRGAQSRQQPISSAPSTRVDRASAETTRRIAHCAAATA